MDHEKTLPLKTIQQQHVPGYTAIHPGVHIALLCAVIQGSPSILWSVESDMSPLGRVVNNSIQPLRR